jgi:anti-anti-sigma regulatory factor
MDIETQIDGQAHLTRSGELTLACAPQLRADLLARLDNGGPVVLDLTDVTEIDLACLQVLAAAECSLRTRGQTLRIWGAKLLEQVWSEAGFPHGE